MLSRFSRALVALVAAGVLLLSPTHRAAAYGFIGFGFGVPVFAPFYPFYPFYGPRVVLAPAPVFYPPPPVVYPSPPPYGTAPPGRCYAGAYVCPLKRPLAVGSPCTCPTNTARAAGRVN